MVFYMKSVEKCITLIILLITAFCNGCTFNNKQEEIKHQDCDWHLEYIHAPMMWAKTKGESITIAIIDSGSDYDFLGQEFDTTRIIATYNAFDCNNDLTDYTSHGTSMVSIIGASGENGFYGVAPACKFIIIKALNEVGTTNSETLIRAIDFAIENKANIINLSLGSENINDNVTTAIMRAVNNNIVVTSAVGDQGKNSILFPALLDNTLSVAAIDCNGLLYNKSNFNESVDVLAPGVDVRIIKYNIFKERIETKKSGSSIATAVFSGILALYLDSLNEYDVIDVYTKFRKIGSIDLLDIIY